MPDLHDLRKSAGAEPADSGVEPVVAPLDSYAGAGSGGASAGGSSAPGASGNAAGGTPSAAGSGVGGTPSGGAAGAAGAGRSLSITTTYDSDLPELGDSPGGSEFADDCEDGSVLAGCNLAMGDFLMQAQGVCRKLEVTQSESTPTGYELRLLDGAVLAPHPEMTTSPVTPLLCAENELVVGLKVAQQHITFSSGDVTTMIPRVWISCAKLTLSKQADGYVVSWSGKRDLTPVSGTEANDTAWFHEVTLPPDVVASRLAGGSGAWVDRLGFGVSKLQVSVVTP